VHEIAEFVAFLKFRARIGVTPMLDETQIASLYAEFADEDSALAKEGMSDYAEGLRQEDAPCYRAPTAVKQDEGTDNRPRMNEGGGQYGISQPAARAVGRWSAL